MLDLLRAFRPIAADFLSTIVFIGALEILNDVRQAIMAGIAAGVLQFGYLIATGRKPAAMQWMSLFLVLTLGGASLFTADPRFVMIKPTIGAWAIALVMLRRGWMLRYLPARAQGRIPDWAVILFGYIWAGWVFALGAANLYVALTFGLRFWSGYSVVAQPIALSTLFVAQYVTFRRLAVRSDGAASGAA